MNPNHAPIDYDAFRREARCLRQQAIDEAITRAHRGIAAVFDRIHTCVRRASARTGSSPAAALTAR